MMSKISSVLFVVLVACGGDKAPTVQSSDSTPFWMPPAKPMAEPAIGDSKPVAIGEPVNVNVDSTVVMPTKYDDALAMGRDLVTKGDAKGAREMFEAAIKLDKKKAEPHIELARLFIASGDKGMAVAAANKGVKLAPLSSVAWNTKGRAELARFDYDAAIEAFSKSVELNRDNVWAWNNLGLAELQLKKYDEAVEHLTEATTRKGATGYMFNNLGTALEQLDRLDEARAAFDAGGKLGSKEAVASRKRLEGVKSIAIAKSTDSTKTFDTNEGETDEDQKLEDGSDAAPSSGSDSSEPADGETTKPTM